MRKELLGMKLLIVNDESIVADAMKEEIPWVEYGVKWVYVAYDAESAKEIIRRIDIDILLSDIEMPRENGLELLRWVREQEKEIECIFLTCHAKFIYAQDAINLRCCDYILTPAKYEDIGKSVCNVVKRIEKYREERRCLEREKISLYERTLDSEKRTPRLKPVQNVEIVEMYIMDHISDSDMSVERLADYFHFHPVYMSRIFRKEKGISINQFIISERMKMAARLLQKGNYSVTEVAEMVGYAHYTNFYNMFKNKYNISPNQYAEKYIEAAKR